MINNNDLHRKIMFETFKIVYESLTEEDFQKFNLSREQVFPTINFFKKIQSHLLEHLTEDKNLYFQIPYIDYNRKTNKFFIVPELAQVNRDFLNYLCQEAGITFYCFEDCYHFETTKENLYTDLKKKYYH